jgi:GAF domain-containing protein
MARVDDERECERLRQGALEELDLDRMADTAYDDLTRAAADICGTPVALVTLIDGDRQWFKSRIGVEVLEIARELTFCAHAIQRPGEILVVEDASADPRFASIPFVTGEAHIRFYAGAPLVTSAGHPVGTLCLLDTEPRKLDPDQLRELRFLAQQVIDTMEKRKDRSDSKLGDLGSP